MNFGSINTGQLVITTMENKTQEKEIGLSNTVLLCDVTTVKEFFKENGLKYDKSISRAENLLANFNRLPVGDECICVISDISFEVKEGQAYKFPANYRAKNVCVYGNGSLSFSGNEPELNGSNVIRTETKLKSVLGVYYPEKSIVWNILNAASVGNWPSSEEIILRGICLNIREEDVEAFCDEDADMKLLALPKNIKFDAPYITDTSGCMLVFQNGELMVTGEKAAALAVGLAAKLGVSAGKGYVCELAEGYAMDTGTIFGMEDGCRIWADGANAKAFGIAGDVFMSVSEGALGIKNVVTVNAEVDHHPNSRVRMSVIHNKLPKELIESKFNFDNGAMRGYVEIILELKVLADLGSEKAALMLGRVNTYNFDNVIKTGEKKDEYLKSAAALDDISVKMKACKLLALYYCEQYYLRSDYRKSGYEVVDYSHVRPKAQRFYAEYCKMCDSQMPDFTHFEQQHVRKY